MGKREVLTRDVSNEIVKIEVGEFEPKLDSATEFEKFLFEDNHTIQFFVSN